MISCVASSINSSEEPLIKKGQELLKKKANGTNLDYLNLINILFFLFNGMLLMVLLAYTQIFFCQLIFSSICSQTYANI